MRLERHEDIIAAVGGRWLVTVVRVEAAASALTQRGHRMSGAIANGELASPTKAKAAARQARLLCIDQDAISAGREKGLIQ